MAVYEVRVTRTVEATDEVDLMVRARSAKAAEAKALRLAKRHAEQYFGPVGTETSFATEDAINVGSGAGYEVL